MPDLLDLLPLYPNDDEAAILQRQRDDANEGLDPSVDVETWCDTREGSMWFMAVMPGVREFARAWDALGTETVAASSPFFSWGEYLDDQASVVQVNRLPGVQASGEVTFEGPAGTEIPLGFTLSIEPATPDAEVPEFATIAAGTVPDGGDGTGRLTVGVRATEFGEIGDVGAGAVIVFSTPSPSPSLTVVNEAAIEGGTEPEDDEALRARVLAAYTSGQGPGNKADYMRWGSAWAGVGRVTVIAEWRGPGTVLLIVTDANGRRLSDDVVDGLRASLDPVAGKGEGQAPISANVTVVTADPLAVVIGGTVELEDGYSLDGASGTVNVSPDIEILLTAYVGHVSSGAEIVLAHVAGLIATVEGVHDISGVTINTRAANVTVPDDPPLSPQLTTPLSLVEGTV